ncbi:MAG: hypothetical protein ACOZQL_33250 [Myxococcota bacterium]
MFRAALLGLALVSGCATVPSREARLTAQLLSVDVDFPTRERGQLRFVIAPPATAPRAQSVSWELFLDGVRFAAGVAAVEPGANGELVVATPLVCRHLSWREGEAKLDVGLRGEVDVGTPGEKLQFKDRRELTVHGRPMLHIPTE